MRYDANHPPVPLNPEIITDHIEPEVWDKHIPRGGFIEDFVLGTRGIETPTKFAVWAGLFAISALVKRDVWYKWYPRPLYPNLFVIFVAPPRICAKSTCVDIGEEVLVNSQNFINDPLLKAGKEVRTHHSKVTPEMLFDVMTPSSGEVKVQKDAVLSDEEEEEIVQQFMENIAKDDPKKVEETYDVTRYADLSLHISELTTFLGKQKYTEHLVDILTYMYDCPERADEATRTYGSKSLEKVYLTFFGIG